MQNAQLVSHVDTDIVTRADLQALPTPGATQTFKPIPHIELVDMLDVVLRQNQIRIEEERFALRRDGSVLFGVLQLAYGETVDGRAAVRLLAKAITAAAAVPVGTRELRSSRIPSSKRGGNA